MDGEAGKKWVSSLDRHCMVGGEGGAGLDLSYVAISDES